MRVHGAENLRKQKLMMSDDVYVHAHFSTGSLLEQNTAFVPNTTLEKNVSAKTYFVWTS